MACPWPKSCAARPRPAASRCTSSCSARCARRSRTASSGPDDALPAERQIWPTDLAVSRITVRKAHRRPGRGRPAGAPPGLGQLRRRAHREELRQADLVLRGHARARAHAAQRLAEALRRHGDARGGAHAAARAPARRSTASTACASPTTRRWRSSTRPSSAACLPSLDAVDDSLYEALEQAGNRPVRALQRLRALLLNAEQAKLLHAHEGDAGPAGRAPRLPARRPRGRVLASPTTAATPTTSSPSSARP